MKCGVVGGKPLYINHNVRLDVCVCRSGEEQSSESKSNLMFFNTESLPSVASDEENETWSFNKDALRRVDFLLTSFRASFFLLSPQCRVLLSLFWCSSFSPIRPSPLPVVKLVEVDASLGQRPNLAVYSTIRYVFVWQQ